MRSESLISLDVNYLHRLLSYYRLLDNSYKIRKSSSAIKSIGDFDVKEILDDMKSIRIDRRILDKIKAISQLILNNKHYYQYLTPFDVTLLKEFLNASSPEDINKILSKYENELIDNYKKFKEFRLIYKEAQSIDDLESWLSKRFNTNSTINNKADYFIARVDELRDIFNQDSSLLNNLIQLINHKLKEILKKKLDEYHPWLVPVVKSSAEYKFFEDLSDSTSSEEFFRKLQSDKAKEYIDKNYDKLTKGLIELARELSKDKQTYNRINALIEAYERRKNPSNSNKPSQISSSQSNQNISNQSVQNPSQNIFIQNQPIVNNSVSPNNTSNVQQNSPVFNNTDINQYDELDNLDSSDYESEEGLKQTKKNKPGFLANIIQFFNSPPDKVSTISKVFFGSLLAFGLVGLVVAAGSIIELADPKRTSGDKTYSLWKLMISLLAGAGLMYWGGSSISSIVKELDEDKRIQPPSVSPSISPPISTQKTLSRSQQGQQLQSQQTQQSQQQQPIVSSPIQSSTQFQKTQSPSQQGSSSQQSGQQQQQPAQQQNQPQDQQNILPQNQLGSSQSQQNILPQNQSGSSQSQQTNQPQSNVGQNLTNQSLLGTQPKSDKPTPPVDLSNFKVQLPSKPDERVLLDWDDKHKDELKNWLTQSFFESFNNFLLNHNDGYVKLVNGFQTDKNEVLRFTKSLVGSWFERYIFYDKQGNYKVSFVLKINTLEARKKKLQNAKDKIDAIIRGFDLDSATSNSLTVASNALKTLIDKIDRFPKNFGFAEIKDKDGNVLGYEKVFDLSDQKSVDDFYNQLANFWASFIAVLGNVGLGSLAMEEKLKEKAPTTTYFEWGKKMFDYIKDNASVRKIWDRFFGYSKQRRDALIDLRTHVFSSVFYSLFGDDNLAQSLKVPP